MLQNKYPILRKTSKGHSYFDLIKKYWRATNKYGVNRTFHRLCSLMRKMDAQSVFIEHISDYSPELLEEKAAIDTYYRRNIKVEVFRFTFLSDEILSIDKLIDLPDDKFLATATLINFKDLNNKWHSYIYESIVCRPKLSNTLLLNNYIHIRKDFHCSIDLGNKKIRSFKINGTFFCQQNGITSVCAHVSLCMLINNMDKKGIKFTAERINKILGIDHINQKVGGARGLSEAQMIQVLEGAGLNVAWQNFFDNPSIDYAEYLYSFMEGGCPALLFFTTKHLNENAAIDDFPLHVVPVIGHTLNSDIWEAEAELAYKRSVTFNYRPASEWVDHFIFHDDNFGMYLCLPTDSLRKITIPKHDPILRAYSAIVVTPISVHTHPGEAEYAGASFLRRLLEQLPINLGIWLKRLADTSIPMVIRTMLMSKEKYKKHLIDEEDFKGEKFKDSEIATMTNNLPRHFWLCEISTPDIYTANKHKILDFIYVCNKKTNITGEDLHNRWIQIRLPGACYFNTRPPSAIRLSVKSHYPLYRHEKDSNVPEW